MIIVGGANGAGKTTFIKKYLEENSDIFYLSADAIAQELSPNDLDAVKIQAGRIFKNKIHELIQNKTKFLVETTLSGSGLFKDILNAKAKGLEIELIYLFNDAVSLCINRVQERVLAGGIMYQKMI